MRLLRQSLCSTPAPAAAGPRRHARPGHSIAQGRGDHGEPDQDVPDLGRAQGRVRARGWPGRGPLAQRSSRPTPEIGNASGCRGDRPPRRSGPLLRHGRLPSANAPSSARHRANQARDDARQAGQPCRSAHGADRPARDATFCSQAAPSPDDSRPEHGRPGPGSTAPATCRATSPRAAAMRGRAGRTSTARSWSPMTAEIVGHDRQRPAPAAADRPSASARVSASRRYVEDCAHVRRAERAHCAGRGGGRWPARGVSRLSGRCARAASACSKYATASR